MKKIFLVLIFLLTLFLGVNRVYAQDDVVIHFFYGDGCPHCAHEEEFLKEIDKEDGIEVRYYETWKNQDNLELFQDTGKALNASISGVPFTVIGSNYVVGWLDEETTGSKIREYIDCYRETKCEDVVQKVMAGENSDTGDSTKDVIPDKISVPIFGDIDTSNISLPALSVIIGVIDGFNPCAMWVLIFLISFLIGMKDRKRMWILGLAFIVASAVVYFLFMSAWLNLLMFLGFIIWVRIIVGVVAIGGGIYNLREYKINKNATCKVTGGEKKQKTFDKLKKYATEKNFWIALGGIVLLAFAVNLVEAICSAGLPVVFTQILTLSDLPTWKYYMYILIYIFFFMLDDLIVFFIAMLTLRLTGLTTKYTRLSYLIGGVIMLIVGVLLIFKPEWLMFG